MFPPVKQKKVLGEKYLLKRIFCWYTFRHRNLKSCTLEPIRTWESLGPTEKETHFWVQCPMPLSSAIVTKRQKYSGTRTSPRGDRKTDSFHSLALFHATSIHCFYKETKLESLLLLKEQCERILPIGVHQTISFGNQKTSFFQNTTHVLQ